VKPLLVWAGPVSSSKSTKALSYASRLVRTGARVVLIRPTCSIRRHEQHGQLLTKSGLTWPATEVQRASQIEAAVPADATVVWIDEPMLFDEEALVYDVVRRLRERYIILVSGLPATSELEPFGTSFPRVMAVADEVIWCKADCDTSRRMESATRSMCLVKKDGQKLVGGEETYRPACPEVWNLWHSAKEHEMQPAR